MMLSDSLKRQGEEATVNIGTMGGRGFLVADNAVLTAAHCIQPVDYEAAPLGTEILETVATKTASFRLAVGALEPIADIAMLSAPDNQEPAFPEDCPLLDSFFVETLPLRLCTEEFKLFESFPVDVFTHEGDWIAGSAKQCARDAPSLAIEFERGIKPGTSGSPIVNSKGEVVGVISNAGGADEETRNVVLAPRPHQALPAWAVRKIAVAESLADQFPS